MRISRRVAVAAAGLVAAAVVGGGCGLLDALDKFKGITFQLPSRMYTVTTEDPRWRSPPPGGVPPVPCGGGLGDCCAPPISCSQFPLMCDEGKCALKFSYEEVSKVDLAKDAPELAAHKGDIFSTVTLKQIDLQIDNGLNVALPTIELYVAPASVTSHTGNGAKRIGTIPRQPAAFKGTVQLPLDDAGQQAFSNFARDFQTPFNFIMSASVVIKSGEPTPMGKIVVVVSGAVEAKF